MIKIDGVEKQFGSLKVLKRIFLQIETGRVTAIVGPNGSGKSTLIKSILGLVRPDKGEIYVNGTRLNGECEYRRQIGYMPQMAHFPNNLNVGEVLYMIKDLRGEHAGLDEELIHEFGLGQERDKPLRTLSGGTRQKVSAAIAFLFDPALLILDEPTAGLDPIASSIFKDKIIREREKGKTIILTSHIMSEIEEMADSIIFLLDGSVRFSGPVEELKTMVGGLNLERSIARMMAENDEA